MHLQVIYELDKADKASVRFTGLEKCNCVQGGQLSINNNLELHNEV